MSRRYWARSWIAYRKLALQLCTWLPVTFPLHHMLISPAPVCCTTCMLSFRATALSCVSLVPMERHVIYCEPRGSKKRSADSTAPKHWTFYYGPELEGGDDQAVSNRRDKHFVTWRLLDAERQAGGSQRRVRKYQAQAIREGA